MLNLSSFLKKIKSWGESEDNILAIALVGSYARNSANDNSDVDLMILCKNPEKYIEDENWINQFGEVEEIKNEVWSQLKTKRVFYKNGPEIEFNFDKKSWANPKDPGTKRVVTDGIKILIDKEKILLHLQQNIKKPLQYLLVGYPYSGKSTLANELKKRLGFAVINIDTMKFEKGYTEVGDDDVPDKVWNQIFKEADELIVKYLKEGKNIANEYAWITKKWRDRAKKVAKDAGFETKIIYVDTPLEVVERRWKENQKTKHRFGWPKHEFRNYINDFEELTEDEKHIIYDQSKPIEDLIKILSV